MGLMIGGVSARDLILDGHSVSLYAGGSPPVKVWPTSGAVQIVLGDLLQARDQFRAAMSARGLDYRTATEIPFDIELVGTGSARNMFQFCYALTHAPDLDTSGVTNMNSMFRDCNSLLTAPAMDTNNATDMGYMFNNCSSLTSVPDMNTSSVTDMNSMFLNCSSLTDGNVRLIGRHPQVNTSVMIYGSGLTREPFYDTAGNPI